MEEADHNLAISTAVDDSTRTSEIHEAAVLAQDVSGIHASYDQRVFSEVQLLEAGARLKLPSQEVLSCSSVHVAALRHSQYLMDSNSTLIFLDLSIDL